MDDRESALVDAAFHAWITLGELLANRAAVTRAEITDSHAMLHEALRAYDRT